MLVLQLGHCIAAPLIAEGAAQIIADGLSAIWATGCGRVDNLEFFRGMLHGVLLNWLLEVVMMRLLALAGALLLSLMCDNADAQVAREAFYSIPSETISAADFLTSKKGTPVALAG